MSSLARANTLYLNYLNKHPLATKSVTSGALNGLNELIASIVVQDYSSFEISSNNKVIKMMFYGSFILTPVSHSLYGVLQRVFSKLSRGKQLSWLLKIMQILTSLSTITPILSSLFTLWVSLINNYKPDNKQFSSYREKALYEFNKVKKVIVNGFYNNYQRNLKSSLVTSTVCLVIAQNFLKPELWVVFFNAVYFVLGTYQNIKQKRNMKRAREEARAMESTKKEN